MINWALASEGATVSGSVNYGAGLGTDYDVTWAINGGTPRYDGNDAHAWPVDSADYPATLEITFVGARDIISVVVWFSDYDGRVTDPGDSDAGFNGIQATDYTIETWNGSTWDTQATITGNTLLKRTHTVSVNTTKVRFVGTADGGATFFAVQELEAWGSPPPSDGEASGSSTASGVNDSTRDSSISGIATATGISTYAAGSSSGVATASAVGQTVKQANGSMTCHSFARAHPPYTEKVLPGNMLTWGIYNCYDGVPGQHLQRLDQYGTQNTGSWEEGWDHWDHNATTGRHPLSNWFDGVKWGSGVTTPPHSTWHTHYDAWTIANDRYGDVPFDAGGLATMGLRIVFPAPLYITGIRIYSGDELKNYSTEPTDVATGTKGIISAQMVAPPEDAAAPSPMFVSNLLNVSGGHESPLTQATTPTNPYDFGGDGYNGAGWFNSPPKLKSTARFVDSHLYAAERKVGYVDIAFGSNGQAQIFEIEILATSIPILELLVDGVHAVANIELHHLVASISSANATAALSGFETQTESSHANATATAPSFGIHTLELTAMGAASAAAIPGRALVLTSSANAVATEDSSTRILALASAANATAIISIRNRPSNTIIEHANAIAKIIERRSIGENSVAIAVSNLDGARIASNAEISQAEVGANVAISRMESTGIAIAVAASIISTKLHAHQILLSGANATTYILFPQALRQAFWSNPISTAAATWGGPSFETMIECAGSMYAAGEGGICVLLDGVDDNGSPIAAEILWDLMDFGDPKKHRLGNVVIGGSSGGPLNVRVINEQGTFNYPTHLPETAEATNLRAKLGKGLNSRYNRIALTNPGGRDFGFNDGSVEMIALSRRIGGKHG